MFTFVGVTQFPEDEPSGGTSDLLALGLGFSTCCSEADEANDLILHAALHLQNGSVNNRTKRDARKEMFRFLSSKKVASNFMDEAKQFLSNSQSRWQNVKELRDSIMNECNMVDPLLIHVVARVFKAHICVVFKHSVWATAHPGSGLVGATLMFAYLGNGIVQKVEHVNWGGIPMGDVKHTGRITRSSRRAMAASTVSASEGAQIGEQCDVVDAVEDVFDKGEVSATVDEKCTNAYRKETLKEVHVMLTHFVEEQQVLANENLVSPEKCPRNVSVTEPPSGTKVVIPEKRSVMTKHECAMHSSERKPVVIPEKHSVTTKHERVTHSSECKPVVIPEKHSVMTKHERVTRSSERKPVVIPEKHSVATKHERAMCSSECKHVVIPEKHSVTTKHKRVTRSSECKPVVIPEKCSSECKRVVSTSLIPKKHSVSNVVISEKHTVKVKCGASAGGSVAKAAASVRAKYTTLHRKKCASTSAEDMFSAEDDVPLSQLLGKKPKRSVRDVSSTSMKHVMRHRKTKQVCKRATTKFHTVVKEVDLQEGQTTAQYGRPEKYMKHKHSYTCCVCNEKFTTLTAYNKHAPIHGYHPCGLLYCNQWFRVLSALEMHRSLHRAGGKLTFPCSTCGEKFSHPSVCDKHAACHGTKLVKCYYTQCTKTFRRKADMKEHMKSHDPGQHVCDICGKQFHAQSNLKKT